MKEEMTSHVITIIHVTNGWILTSGSGAGGHIVVNDYTKVFSTPIQLSEHIRLWALTQETKLKDA